MFLIGFFCGSSHVQLDRDMPTVYCVSTLPPPVTHLGQVRHHCTKVVMVNLEEGANQPGDGSLSCRR